MTVIRPLDKPRRKLTAAEADKLDELLDLDTSKGRLDDWSLLFIEDLHRKRDQLLTERQIDKLVSVHKEKCG